MKKYPTETVRLFVEDALSVTRSPGKIEVYKAWINEHPTQSQQFSKMISGMWAKTLANYLGVPQPETETRAFHHRFTNNPEQPSGIIEIVFDEAMELPDTCYDCDTRPACCKEYQEEGD